MQFITRLQTRILTVCALLLVGACDSNPTENVEVEPNLAFATQSSFGDMAIGYPVAAVVGKDGKLTLESISDGYNFSQPIDPRTERGHYGAGNLVDLGEDDNDLELVFPVKKFTSTGELPFSLAGSIVAYQVLVQRYDSEFEMTYLEEVGPFESTTVSESSYRIQLDRSALGLSSSDYVVVFAVVMPGTEYRRIGRTQMTGEWVFAANGGFMGSARGSLGTPLVGYINQGPILNRSDSGSSGLDLINKIYTARQTRN